MKTHPTIQTFHSHPCSVYSSLPVRGGTKFISPLTTVFKEVKI